MDDVTEKIHARTMITLLEKVIEDRVQNRADVVAYSIGGRSLSREPLENLYRLLNRYRGEFAFRKRGGKRESIFTYRGTFGHVTGIRGGSDGIVG